MERTRDRENIDSFPAEEDGGGSGSLLTIVWRRKLIILLLTVVGGALGYLYFVQCPPTFQSTAQMLIIKKSANLPVQGLEGKSAYDDAGSKDINMHALLLRSPTVAAKAIEKHQLASLPSFRDVSNPVGLIIGGLGVDCKGSGSTSVVGLTFKGSNSEDCGEVLAAIVKTYQDFLGETYHDYSEETVQLITQAKDQLLQQLKEKETGYRDFRQTAPLLWKGEAGSNLHESRLAEIEVNRSKLIVETSQTKSRLEALEAALKKGKREAITLLIGTSASGGNSKTPFDDGLFSARLEEQLLLEEFGPDHPKVKLLRRKMELLRGELGQKTSADKPGDLVTTYFDSLRQDLDLQDARMQAFDALFDKERESAKAMTVFQVQDEGFRSEIARTQQLFNAVIKRLEEISLVKDYGGVKTELTAKAGPGVQIAPKLANSLGASCMLGLLAGVGLAWLIEVLDKRFRAPEEIRKNLGVPILGHIPMIESHGKKSSKHEAASLTLCVLHRPTGRQAEAYRAIRTAIYFSAHSQDHRVIQVTSPNPGDGKTTTATNLALSIAESGKKVLLIDADFRRPRVHKYLGLDNEIGLWGAIEGNTEITDAIRSTSVENLSVMTSGGRPPNPAELLTSARFKEFIDVVKERFDLVIVDTPPVLAVTDASAVAPRVDAVVLVIRLTKNSRITALHATEDLTSLGANILGVVVNGVVSGSKFYGSYGYGGYGRGYGYAYRYRDSKGYEESHRGYYAEDDLAEGENGSGESSGEEAGEVETAKNGNGNGHGNGHGAVPKKRRQETPSGAE